MGLKWKKNQEHKRVAYYFLLIFPSPIKFELLFFAVDAIEVNVQVLCQVASGLRLFAWILGLGLIKDILGISTTKKMSTNVKSSFSAALILERLR